MTRPQIRVRKKMRSRLRALLLAAMERDAFHRLIPRDILVLDSRFNLTGDDDIKRPQIPRNAVEGLTELADKLGVSKQRVHQLEALAVERLAKLDEEFSAELKLLISAKKRE